MPGKRDLVCLPTYFLSPRNISYSDGENDFYLDPFQIRRRVAQSDLSPQPER